MESLKFGVLKYPTHNSKRKNYEIKAKYNNTSTTV